MTKNQLLCGLAVLTSCGGSASTAFDDDTHLIRVAVSSRGDRTGIAAFEQVVESLSGGRVEVEIDIGGQICEQTAGCVDALEAGQVDVYAAGVDELVSLFPELQVLEVPYLFENDRVIEHVFAGSFYGRIAAAIADRADLHLMTMTHGDGWRGIATNAHEVRHPDDVGGLTFRAPDSPLQLELTRAFGAEPRVAMKPRSVGGSAGNGDPNAMLIGVLELGTEHMAGFEHLTLDRHSYGLSLWLMRDAAYEALSDDLQQIVRVGFDELRRLSFAFPNRAETDALTMFETTGGTLSLPTPTERRAFVMAAGRVSTWFMDTYGPDWLVWLEEAIAEAERQVGRAP